MSNNVISVKAIYSWLSFLRRQESRINVNMDSSIRWNDKSQNTSTPAFPKNNQTNDNEPAQIRQDQCPLT
ncbi:MAG: hypothetical protein ACD_62C00070G0005 [uncultured bacterium]|nr:MAG: hypothetical protein ACD_62C00070G0005 [uncultured bacterium]